MPLTSGGSPNVTIGGRKKRKRGRSIRGVKKISRKKY